MRVLRFLLLNYLYLLVALFFMGAVLGLLDAIYG